MGQLYIMEEEIYNRFSENEISQLCGDDPERLTAAIVSASALINSSIAPRYKLPLVNKHEVLTGICADIVYYKLYNIDPPEAAKKRYDDAIAFLDKIAAGKMTLSEPQGEESEAKAKVYYRAKPRRFSDDILGGW